MKFTNAPLDLTNRAHLEYLRCELAVASAEGGNTEKILRLEEAIAILDRITRK